MDGWQTDPGLGRDPSGQEKNRLLTIVGTSLLVLTLVSGFYVQTGTNKGASATPAPYDLMMVLTMAVYFAVGLKFPVQLRGPALLWGLFLLGYGFSGIGAVYIERVSDFMLVSVYLVASMLFFAALAAADPKRNLSIVWWAYTLAAFIAGGAGTAAYFGLLPNSESFLLYGRVKSTFNDPNVFAPFLIGPTLFLVLRLSMSSQRRDFLLVPVVGVLFLAIFLSFSRGAWGNLIASGGMFLILTWMTADSARQIARLTFAMILITALGACVIAWALTSDVVSELFEERFALTQSYDVDAPGGRFTVQSEALETVLTEPLGIGPSQWAKIAKADPHNVYLNVFLAGGWLSGFAFAGLVLWTVVAGVRSCFVRTGYQGLQIVAVATFAGHMLEAFVIDIDNWRHVYLLMGLIWGGIAYAAREPAGAARRDTRQAQPIPVRDGFAV
ncbi:MAG: O-antigen ligase family protein [Parvibaculaceae bacterium]